MVECRSATDHGQLMLLETSYGLPNLLPVLPTVQRFSLPQVFHNIEHRPRMITPKPAIFRNAQGQRVDPPLNPKETMVVWLRAQKFCNNHFLQGQCPEPRCKARHDGRLTSEQLDALRYLGRSLPCRYSNQCRDPECYAGHMCSFQPCANRNCKFYAEMHVIDRRIVSQDPWAIMEHWGWSTASYTPGKLSKRDESHENATVYFCNHHLSNFITQQPCAISRGRELSEKTNVPGSVIAFQDKICQASGWCSLGAIWRPVPHVWLQRIEERNFAAIA